MENDSFVYLLRQLIITIRPDFSSERNEIFDLSGVGIDCPLGKFRASHLWS